MTVDSKTYAGLLALVGEVFDGSGYVFKAAVSGSATIYRVSFERDGERVEVGASASIDQLCRLVEMYRKA